MGGKTDIRWGDVEWAALERWAAARGLSPGRAAKVIVLGQLGHVRGGPAAPEERESGGGDTEPSQSVRAKTVRGRPASSRSALGRGSSAPGPAAAPSRAPVMGAKFIREVVTAERRPVGSAGSVGPVPPAGVAAPVVDPPPAAGAPDSGFVPVLEAVAALLRRQGMAGSQAVLVARRAILGGQVVVDGEVCRDPATLADPGSLGVG